MKPLLYILCLFVLSCDSGGDDTNDISLSDLNGEWWTERCDEFSGDNCYNEVGVEDCESSEYFYMKFDNAIQYDCWTNQDPECPPEETGTVTLSGNYLSVCADNWEDEDDRCFEGTLDINEDSFEFIMIEEIDEGCERIKKITAERKD